MVYNEDSAKLCRTARAVLVSHFLSFKSPSELLKQLGVSPDYLVGNSDIEVNKDTLKRLQDNENLPTEDKSNILYTIDGLIKAARLKAI